MNLVLVLRECTEPLFKVVVFFFVVPCGNIGTFTAVGSISCGLWLLLILILLPFYLKAFHISDIRLTLLLSR